MSDTAHHFAYVAAATVLTAMKVTSRLVFAVYCIALNFSSNVTPAPTEVEE